MPRPTTADKAIPIRVVIATLDSHLASATDRTRRTLRRELPGLELDLHAVSEWGRDQAALERARSDIEKADIIVVSMLFMEDHIQAVLPSLEKRRDECDAIAVGMSAGEVIRLTRLGQFQMNARERGIIALLKRLRGSATSKQSSGARQMAMLRRLPKILRFIPGSAQDVRAYFLTLQYLLAGSEENLVNLVRFLVNRYANGPRQALRGSLKPRAPIEYPDVGVYHPQLPDRLSENRADLPKRRRANGTVGLLLMRSYPIAGNTQHYDGVINALEARGLNVIPAFATGLDSRPAIEKYFLKKGKPAVDAVVSLTGFSLVGGPAYNDAKAAEDILARLDVPYLAAQAVEFETLEDWMSSDRGLLPVETTMMIAIPELDGSTGPIVFGGRSEHGATQCDMQAHPERVAMLARRVAKLVSLRNTARCDRKLGITLFNFPPNSGATGTAAYLSVWESLFRTLRELAKSGYTVELPESVDDLRTQVLEGNASRYGASANVFARIDVDDHIRKEPYLADIEAQWGPAPGKHQADGSSIHVLGQLFGNVFVGIQPSFGYEGDPMRLLFEKGFSPTHAFSAFYRYLREDFGADAVLHFGTHGALEFMPGKQAGMSEQCWPDRLIGDIPNVYAYAVNNPSEGTIAKRRSAATLVSYLTPPVSHAGLYRGLIDLKTSLERWRALEPNDRAERDRLAPVLQAQASELNLTDAVPAWDDGDQTDAQVLQLIDAVHELEYELIPHGLHVLGEAPDREETAELLLAVAEARGMRPDARSIEMLLDGAKTDKAAQHSGLDPSEDSDALFSSLAETAALLQENGELSALIHALDGGFTRPAPAGDLLRNPEILPTGRNIHGFDPFRIPSAFAISDGKQQADRLLAKHMSSGFGLPRSIALVLWGTDNLKSEGGPIAQALALMGAQPRFDSYGRLCGAELISLEELGRPRIDVVMTLSGIFRDLLPLQSKLLAEAAYLAASADEPLDQNFIRQSALEYQHVHGCDLETAALRVFSNAEGAYGSNVNQLVDSGRWNDEEEIAEVYTRRKCFAYGRDGAPQAKRDLLQSILSNVDLAYQNLESVELGVTTVDHYFDTLGGISRAATKARGEAMPVYVGDQTRGPGKVRTLSEQVALETRTRVLNPKWYEGMLKHGYEGVRQIESHVTNTMGWSATTGQVAPWVYEDLSDAFVLDDAMRERLASLNPIASAKVANRLLEAHERNYWKPDEATLEALRKAGEELEDRIEGVGLEEVAA
ncbi:MAG: magnesium chelatase subunit H [Pseudomonadota bacterium]